MNHVIYHKGCTFVVQNPTVEGFKMNLCPVCQKPAKMTCKCPRLDSTCENGHEWHYCPVHHDKVNLGHSDHAKSDCTCPKEEETLTEGYGGWGHGYSGVEE